jgi:nucleoside-diphosphate-sugar epimerase
MKILVTGGCGYKGSVLVPKLLTAGHEVLVVDTQWFGNNLEPNKNLQVLRLDIRNIDLIPFKGIECVIHLASVANDPCSDLNPKLTWEVSCLATMQLIEKCKNYGIKRFIYASSGSVYGIKSELDVTEDMELVPISEYNKTKMISERVLLSYGEVVNVQIVRPATVCGYSPRMRLDVAVNLLTMQALTRKKITVLGGGQVRPNIHIEDIADVYMHMINNPSLTGIYNAGFENISILEIARLISKKLEVEIDVKPSNDPRSYRLNSEKLINTGYRPKKNVEIAIEEIINLYRKGLLEESDINYNLKWMIQNKYHE